MILLSVAALLILMLPIASQSEISQGTEKSTSADYLEALRVANSFLWAWVARDSGAGLQLISTRLRTEIKDESWLRQFMMGLSNPHHQAFELGVGRREGAIRYSFPVTLYELYSGENEGFAYTGVLGLVKQGDVWRIDVLPKLP